MKRIKNIFFKGFIRSFLSSLLILVTFGLLTLTLVLNFKQDELVQSLIEELNVDFKGRIELEDSHISLFSNFPYVSIDLERVHIYEGKSQEEKAIVDIKDVYVGFDLMSVFSQEFQIKKIKAKNGVLHLIQYEDGTLNLAKAFEPIKEIEEVSEALHLNLKKIQLEDIDVRKEKPDDDLVLETYIFKATSGFKQVDEDLMVHLNSDMEFNVIMGGDTSYYKHKHLSIETDIKFDTEQMLLEIAPTKAELAHAEFDIEGSLNLKKDSINLHFFGDKENFDLFLSFAPTEVQEFTEQYSNEGHIWFDAKVNGSFARNELPYVYVDFGCEDAHVTDLESSKNLSEINFHGAFTNGKERMPESTVFQLDSISFKAGSGYVRGSMTAKNLDSLDVDFKLKSDLDLAYLADFFNTKEYDDLKGKVGFDIRFHDIIDLESPEKTLENFEDSYYMSLDVVDFSINDLYNSLSFTDFNLHGELQGEQWIINKCAGKLGDSDFDIKGSLSDLPAVVHHTDEEVDIDLHIRSKKLDLFQLTGADSNAVDDVIHDFSTDLKFTSSAKKITESPNLPLGEFFVENFFARFEHYPHSFHDFHADIIIDEHDLSLIDFKGELDKSDFLFTGKLKNYDLWFEPQPKGHTTVEFDYSSEHLNLDDVLTYKGENYLPEEYKHERFDRLKFHGDVDMVFDDSIQSVDLKLSHLEAGMQLHPMRFKEFSGRVHYEDDHVQIKQFGGKLGKSDFVMDLNYYLGENKDIRLRDNLFSIKSTALDLDEILLFDMGEEESGHHEEAFNIYELPFVDMKFKADVGDFKYHRYHLTDIHADLHITPDHYLYVDKMNFNAAGGEFKINGYFDGRNPDLIYFNPTIQITDIDLDQLLFKFENFGQDHVISENIHGNFSGLLKGKIHVYPDFTPKLDDSDISMDITITDGALEDLLLLEDMSDYFKDKNLKKVKFDTLSNHFEMEHGKVIIPNMEINSSLGHLVIEGEQTLDGQIDYYLKIPWKLVNQVAYSKLFKKKKDVSSDKEDDIVYAKDKQKYVGIRIWTVGEDYKVKLSKKKK